MADEEFGPYLLQEVIGRGGMGVVYRAFDTRRDRIVALKRLPSDLASDESFQARFRRESRLAARLNEPHIIPIHDFGEIENQLYIDMRLVEGDDLSNLITEDGALDAQFCVDVIGQVASALSAAHEAGLMHRDIKPSNVLVTGITPEDKGSPFAYLVDFGIARAMGNEGTNLTQTTDWFGTVAYMAPERISGSSGDARSDIYSLACLFYQCLVGQAPFTGEALQVLFAHVNNPAPAASRTERRVPPALDAVIARGMAKNPDDRYQTAAEFASAARAALRGPGVSPTVPPPPGLPFPPGGPRGPQSYPPGGPRGPQSYPPGGPRGPQSYPPGGPRGPQSYPPGGPRPGAPRTGGPPQSYPPGPPRTGGPPQSYPPGAPRTGGPPQSYPPGAPRTGGPPRTGAPGGPAGPRGTQSGPPRSVPPQGPPRSVPPQAGPPRSVPPRSVPPRPAPPSGPPHSVPPPAGPPHSVPPSGPPHSVPPLSSSASNPPSAGPVRSVPPPAGPRHAGPSDSVPPAGTGTASATASTAESSTSSTASAEESVDLSKTDTSPATTESASGDSDGGSDSTDATVAGSRPGATPSFAAGRPTPTSGPMPPRNPTFPPTPGSGGSSGGSSGGPNRTLILVIAAAVVVVLIAVIAIVATSGGDDPKQSASPSQPSTPVTTSTSPLFSGSVPPSTPTSPAASWNSDYTQFSVLIGSGPGSRSTAYRNADCKLAGPASGVIGMIDQVTCTDLSGGSPVSYAVGRFSSKGAVDNYVASLRKLKYTYKPWGFGQESNRGRNLRAPTSQDPDVVTTFCGLPTYIIDFSADKSSKLTSVQIYNDLWKPAPFPTTAEC